MGIMKLTAFVISPIHRLCVEYLNGYQRNDKITSFQRQVIFLWPECQKNAEIFIGGGPIIA